MSAVVGVTYRLRPSYKGSETYVGFWWREVPVRSSRQSVSGRLGTLSTAGLGTGRHFHRMSGETGPEGVERVSEGCLSNCSGTWRDDPGTRGRHRTLWPTVGRGSSPDGHWTAHGCRVTRRGVDTLSRVRGRGADGVDGQDPVGSRSPLALWSRPLVGPVGLTLSRSTPPLGPSFPLEG